MKASESKYTDQEIDRHLVIRGDDRYPGEDKNRRIKFSSLSESVKDGLREDYAILKSGKVDSFNGYFGGHNWEIYLNAARSTNSIVANALNAVINAADLGKAISN